MNLLLSNLVLAMIWAALTDTFTGGGLFAGFILSYLVLIFVFRQHPDVRKYRLQVPRFISFMVFFTKELIMANLKVAYDVLTPTNLMKPGVIAMPLRAKTDMEITILANAISLTPGSLSLDVSTDRLVLYVHVMYLYDEQEVLSELKRLETKILRVMR
ncbi:cation:proton antiporter [Arsukibacterium sp. MJ3]|jgi:multicomponent Na+:H+ antiporter subunit E|uniref:Na+/H+ antiporter subunit E n=1 Tax=Arsukibacterium sp. MJ3 TaxID=1632859 RepID=UPI000627318C|nr:Na+/H+ antiporter subunit E [Arsukibacterium sp. MJ3]KKO49570.1 cation:proton antiporter [Arsukibacterium sp. MJ3]